MYTKEQKSIIKHTESKVRDFLKSNPAPSHDYGHADRVRLFAIRLAKAHGGNIFLSALSGLLHDIGRADEQKFPGITHHEISYELCRQWFRADPMYSSLSRQEKTIILYSIRNHWNNFADKYWEAVILRDADKLDLFGPILWTREKQNPSADWKKIQNDIRLIYDDFYWLRTPTAKRIAGGKNFIGWTNQFYKKLLSARIKPVEL
ncbi:MAG: hypothetical protein A2534_05045 [Candidatus Magasanikbacteria bacterium RIFOXYD2_FULL_39_9]|uniref:HD/PDEase domain-containing protein n=1 Tax=Candidatus Magasanikbacteria bacterium RIFOXYD1_FULL_40_23 TaxID=1798705 RepID=A0A1F6P9S7_9BACT|nr:MAG: hypothetical protein A2534_05045 [Candidatus Magasanikbacteria bacterium RIFOXYD2_FULL_39_9]OGH92868.1 MAG: hypothetical protein A2563_04350 [Candidatus Magasanikbacteria bacterium RIFOXYD1_FULL_40_23]